jgi:hypothetical protein
MNIQPWQLAVGAPILITIGACAHPGQPATPVVEHANTDTNVVLNETRQQLSDGRTITCLIYTGGGVSCDWANVK